MDPKHILSHPKLKLVDLKLIFIDPTLIYSNPREKESERERERESSDKRRILRPPLVFTEGSSPLMYLI